MLVGRESLVRLIGKRRRVLPNRQSIVASTVQSTLSLCKGDGYGGSGSDVGGEGSSEQCSSNGVEKSTTEWVACPVCGERVHGDGLLINSHLDACLARGTKRKLSQRTLFQLNFCSRSTSKVNSIESDNVETNDVPKGHGDDFYDMKPKLQDLGGYEEYNSTKSKSPVNSKVLVLMYGAGLKKDPVSDDDIKNRVELPLLLTEDEMTQHNAIEFVSAISDVILETSIVGRRFGDKVELSPGLSIFLVRDPDNVVDPNAVKVICADCGSSKLLGFLPRELAQYMSPLMDKFYLSFEGHITSVPKHARNVVPIQISCQNAISHGEKEHYDLQLLKSLWEQALGVVESAKIHLTGMAKYQKNFVLMTEEVLRGNSHLFTNDEKTFLETFTSLSDDSQRLFVRLYMRKGPWFQMSNVLYPEIFDNQAAMNELSVAGYFSLITSANDLHRDNLKEVLNVLTVGELREILSLLNKTSDHSKRKQDLIALVISLFEDGRSSPLLRGWIFERTGVCSRISMMAESLVWRAERLFFLNGEQDLSAFLLVDLGIIKFPNYNCVICDPIFSCRSDLLSYEEAIEVAQIMDQSLGENQSDMVLRCIEVSFNRLCDSSGKAVIPSSSVSEAAFLSCFSASWVYSKVVLLGASFLEREQRYHDAIKLLKQLLVNFPSDGRRGYWTLRLSVDLEHVGQVNESLLVAENGLLDPWIRAGSMVALQRRVLRLGKPPRRWKKPSFSDSVMRKIAEVHVQGRPLNCKTGSKSRFYGHDGEQCGVEQLALQYYAADEGGGWQGVHTESGIWLTIFGLLMWDVIFSDVPNIFRTRFQTAPLDMGTESFYEARKTLIEPQLQNIRDGMAEEIIITSWESHVGTACRGVNWEKHSLEELRAAVTCIGGPCLASICRNLAQDYRSWSSGMPDLLLWRFHDDYRGEAKLVEVKGPRDRLSEQQRAWLLFLMDCGFNTEVCKVTPPVLST